MGEALLQRRQRRESAVDGESRAACKSSCVRTRIDPAGLVRGDLGQVEDVADVDPVARDLDTAEAVDGEVAERVRRGHDRGGERRQRDEDQDELLHEAYLRATGAQRSENCGLTASARENQR